jgi:hypothetical protein
MAMPRALQRVLPRVSAQLASCRVNARVHLIQRF